ncbi:MAG: hypothetical protein ACI9VM_000849 [Candidatus Azotimanducaceae bacterium]|jgi:hypothetical protein
MLDNNNQFSAYFNTAGKLTIATAFFAVAVFTLIFLLNIGTKEFKQATAETGVATTSITVLNTPPAFVAGPFESPESSTSSPTNSGDVMTWVATADDPSGNDYYLLICDGETASPTAFNGAAPTCDGSDVTWGVSALASSSVQASVSTTTLEGFAESNVWLAWVCDSVAINPRCNNIALQGTGSTSSPFNVNHRPTFSGFGNDGPADPGAFVTFYATSTDADTDPIQDAVQLHVCTTNSFSGGACDVGTLATSSFFHPNATATYAIPGIYQDDDYNGYGYIIDIHGHVSTDVSQGTNSLWTANNVAPQVHGGTTILNEGVDFTLIEAIETTGFTLEFEVTDANSCDAVGGGANDEFSTSTVVIYNTFIATSTCDGSAGSYDPNNCYPSGAAAADWNLSCMASSTTCGGSADDTITVECTFPLWFIADPTNGADASTTVHFAEAWAASVSATDDDGATGLLREGDSPVEVLAVTAINLIDSAIPYAALEPGSDSTTLSTTTNAQSTGNTGLDEGITGESMCNGYTTGNDCTTSATSTIPAASQEYGTSSIAYGAGFALSSTTNPTLEINITKSLSTTTPSNADTYWGIGIPSSITFAGIYTGENTISAVFSDPSEW